MEQDNSLVKLNDLETIRSSLPALLCNQSVTEVRLRVDCSVIFLHKRTNDETNIGNLDCALVIYGDCSLTGLEGIELVKEANWLDSYNFSHLLCQTVKQASIKDDGQLEIRFESGAILTAVGEQVNEIEESWVLFASADIYNVDIFSAAVPTANSISVDSSNGEVIAFFREELINSNQE